MTTQARSYNGGATATTLSSGIGTSDTSITIASFTGWPDGTSGPWFIVIGRGTSTEEKVKIASRSGTTLTVASSGRGADGTSAASHSSGAAVEACISADDIAQLNTHATSTGVDDHTQYLNTTRHDVTARHTFGAGLGTPGAATTSAVGDAAATGSGSVPARSDHVHGREAFATNAIVLGTAAAAGAATTLIRSDATIAAFDATNPAASAVGDTVVVGTAAFAARRDHRHAREAFGSPVAVDPAALADGTATTVARSDHKHIGAGTLASGYAQVTANQGSITTEADLTSLTVTVTAVTGRRYKITGFVKAGSTVGTDQMALTIKESTTALSIATGGNSGATANQNSTLCAIAVITPSAGSHTYKLTLQRSTGSGTVTMTAGATEPAFILIEDIST